MYPASTTKLRPGDFCFIPRDSGGFVPFVYICSPAKIRSSFYGALCNFISSEPHIVRLPDRLTIRHVAFVHVSSFKENGTPIVGNIAERIGDIVLKRAGEAATSREVGTVSLVWGYKTIIKRAGEVA